MEYMNATRIYWLYETAHVHLSTGLRNDFANAGCCHEYRLVKCEHDIRSHKSYTTVGLFNNVVSRPNPIDTIAARSSDELV